MSCVEKRHLSHRVGSMLHHRFPNGFTDLSMDDTDREVSTLTDRAFRSLCVGDDAVYNDELLYGYSPFSCHKPLAGEPPKKTQHKESKKPVQSKSDKKAMPGRQKNISHMSSFLKAFGASEGSCEGMLIKNGDSNGESWDKSALRSIQRELSEFSSDYHTSLTGGHHKNHQHSSDGLSNKTGRDVLSSGKSPKIKNGKSTVKLRKLNIKNFFLHSEFSPFQTWRDFNQFPFGQEDSVTPLVPTDNVPKWYDLPFYKELTEAHRKETLHLEENQSRQKAAVELPPPTAPKPIPPIQSPPKLMPKPFATTAEKRCSSERSEGAAPWRRNRSRANSAIPANQPATLSQDNCLTAVNESLLLLKKEARSVEVKAVEEVNSLASTPFSICQLMTPLIPSRQPTETSEILQTVLSPSVLDLPLRPHSEVKLTPEPPVKRDSYKSLASSILFNLKDNRKRVKSRYSPPKFKTLEVPEGTSPQSDHLKHPQVGSDGNESGIITPAVLKDEQTVCSPLVESPPVGLTKYDPDQPLADDYLISNLLQTKREAASNLGEENPISPLIHSKKNKSPAKKQNYPSLNLYKKANNVDNDMKYLQVPLSPEASLHTDQPAETNELSSLTLNKELSPTSIGLSPNTLNVNKDLSPIISPHVLEKEGMSPNVLAGKRPPNVPDKPKRPVKEIKEKDSGTQPSNSKEKDSSGQSIRTKDVIRAAREAINAAKKSINKPNSDIEASREKEFDEKIVYSKEMTSSRRKSSTENKNVLSQSGIEVSGERKKAPPPVPKRNLSKSDIQVALDKHTHNTEKLTNGDLGEAKDDESVQKKSKLKHIFSARQNNYIKCQRFAVTDDEQRDEYEKSDLKDEVRDSEHIINDLHALKELERARLGEQIQENTKNKFEVINLDEEARVKNDLISRELRNIKKGMMSMRGNTTAKRDIFAKKEKEPIKPETFKKIDSNVIVNKALINDNYDKAKLALEEIISERQIRRNKMTEKDANPIFEENADESCLARMQQRKTAEAESLTESRGKDLKERLVDLRDHSHMRQILSQTEPRPGESQRSGGRTALPTTVGKEPDTPQKNKTKYVTDKLFDDPSYVAENSEIERNTLRHMSKDTREELMTKDMKINTPAVPPRIRKEENGRDGSVNLETDQLEDGLLEDVNKHGIHDNFESHLVKDMISSGSGKADVDRGLFMKDTFPIQRQTSSNKEKQNIVNANLESITATDAVICDNVISSKYQQMGNTLCFSPEFRGNEYKTNNLQTDLSFTVDNNSKSQQTCKVKRKASLKTDNLTTPDVTKSLVSEEEPDRINTAGEEVNVDAETLSETSRTITSPLLLVNGLSNTQSPPDHSSLSSKSSYFSVESALHRNTESNVYQSLENLIGEVEEHGEIEEHLSTRNSKQDSDRTEAEYYSLSDHDSEPELIKQPIKLPQKEKEVLYKEEKGKENMTLGQSLNHDDNNQTSSNVFSPTLGIPALFKVKDNTFSNKAKKTLQPWSPRGNLIGSERVEEELRQGKENPEIPLDNTSKVKMAQPWSPRGSLSGSDRVEEELHQGKENSEIPIDNISKVTMVQPWSPRGSLSGSDRVEEELHQGKENPQITLDNTSKAKTVQPWSPRGILIGSEREEVEEELHQGKDNSEIPLNNTSKEKMVQHWSPRGISSEREEEELQQGKENSQITLDNTSKVKMIQPWSPRGILIGSERGEEELRQGEENPQITLDNTSKVKMIQPWSPRGISIGSERGEEEFHQGKENLESPLNNTSKVKMVQPWLPRGTGSEREEEELQQGKENPQITLDNMPKVKMVQPWSPRGILIGSERGEEELHQGKENSEIPLDKTSKVKLIQPWSPRGILIGSEREKEELHQIKKNPKISLANETVTSGSTSVEDEIFKSQEMLSNHSTPLLLSPSNLQSNNVNKPQVRGFLTVPQEEDRLSEVSPSSEGAENPSDTTAVDLRVNANKPAEREVSRVPSERSGSTCSGNDSQTGAPKPPPTVLPKSEKAVLKAMKLTTRRIKKEEKNKKSELKSSRNGKSSEKKHREKVEDSHHDNNRHHSRSSSDRNEQRLREKRISHNTENHHCNKTEMTSNTQRWSHDSVENNQNNESLPRVSAERQGRGNDRRIRDKPEQRHYSSDRVISNVPVYKANISDRPTSDRTFQRSQSTDRYFGGKAERRLSADMSINEKLDSRSQRIEKSIMDELQQRGRAREKPSRDWPSKDNPQRRSHSIDPYSSEVPPTSGLSRQSSHTSQLSRQSSMEHAIVTQSIPMTQRKLLQDPDSGQFFFVDMPVQVKTKTFFDPETGTYVQLPVQPPEAAVLKPSPMEVLTPPLVVYHSFVPVPLSPMAQKASVQTSQVEQEEFELRQVESSKPRHCQDGRPYLEPVCSQHDHMLGEFLGTEELDCPG